MKKKQTLEMNIIAVTLMLLPMSSYAVMSTGVDTMFANFTASAKSLIDLIKYLAFIIGLFFVIASIFKFSQLGSNQQLSPKTPIVMFFVGIGIFSLISTVSILSQTLSMGIGPGDSLVPVRPGLGSVTKEGLTGVLWFVRLVGYIAFIRGWLLLNQAGQGKDGSIGRALTHLGGGVAAINIDITAKILMNTFAPGATPLF